jgi:cell division protein FtsI (penicillin-binding protein 3)
VTARARRQSRAAPTGLAERRIGLLFAVFLVVLGAAAVRAGYLSAFKGGELRLLAAKQQVENSTVVARRGTITDRRGRELAVSEEGGTVYATPYLVKDPVRTASRIAPLLGQSAEKLAAVLADRRRGFVYLARKLKGKQAARIERLRIEGIGVLDDERRYYPEGALASQVLGTVGVDNVGLSGLELALDETLRGSDGRRRVVRDALGDPISLEQIEGENAGEDLKLTLDVGLQGSAESVLAQVGETYRPKGATAIVMNPRNGDILAMANWPRVDANNVGGAPAAARFNRAVGLTYEPGSTFKSITVAGALEERLVAPRTTYTLAPQIQVADRVIKEAHDGGGGVLNVSQILAYSSNVGAVKIGLELGAERFDKWVRRFGFGRDMELPLPGQSAGIVPGVKDYSGSSMGNLPLGQGLSVTPIQIAAAYAAIANGGILVEPRIVSSGSAASGRRVISERTAERLQRMLEGALGPGGTAVEAAVEGYDIAGKTGTAEKAVAGGYSESRFVASFIGFAPARDARLLVAVIVDEPKGAYYGGEVAAPAFEKIASFALPYLEIPPG